MQAMYSTARDAELPVLVSLPDQGHLHAPTACCQARKRCMQLPNQRAASGCVDLCLGGLCRRSRLPAYPPTKLSSFMQAGVGEGSSAGNQSQWHADLPVMHINSWVALRLQAGHQPKMVRVLSNVMHNHVGFHCTGRHGYQAGPADASSSNYTESANGHRCWALMCSSSSRLQELTSMTCPHSRGKPLWSRSRRQRHSLWHP